jgi:parallel beta-helix repeat protein
VHDNTAIGNTGGILVFELPGLPMQGGRTSVHDNEIVMNNLDNFAEEGTIVSYLPKGAGLTILAANDVEIYNNTITSNDTGGVLMVSYQTIALLGAPASMDTTYDPFLENVYVHDNTFMQNGTMPELESVIGRDNDVLWDGRVKPMDTPMTLCFQGEGNFRNLNIAVDPAMPIFDRTPHDCMKDPIPPVTLE